MSNNDELLQAMMAVWVKHPGGMTQAMAAILDFLHQNGYRRCAEGQGVTQWCERAEKAEAEVAHWREARRSAIEAGDALMAEVERLRKGIAAVSALIADSSGVYGLHLNGDPAPWDELLSGGQFEEWLADFDAARGES